MLDAKIASALNKIIQNSHFKKKVSLEEQKAQKEGRFLRGRQIAFMIYDYFRVTGAHVRVLDYADLFSVTLHEDNVQEIDTRWDEVILFQRFHLRISRKVCTNWEYVSLYDMGIHHKISMPNYQKLKTMVKRNIDQKLRLRNFDARHGRIETGAVIQKEEKVFVTSGKKKLKCSKGHQCSFRHESNDRAQKTRTQSRLTFRALDVTRSKCVEEKKYPRQK